MRHVGSKVGKTPIYHWRTLTFPDTSNLASAIFGIIAGSIGIISALVGVAKRSVGASRSRQHLLKVQKEKRTLRRRLRDAESEIRLLGGINSKGVYYLRRETLNLIRHSRRQIKEFERFRNMFFKSRNFRNWHYIAISAGRDTIRKYSKRFAMYLDWITIVRLSISLTLISERSSLDGINLSSSYLRDVVNRLRDDLNRAKLSEEEHPGRLRKLHVNKGVNLEIIEKYAHGLVLRFAASDTGTESSSSIVIVDDLREVPVQYRPMSGTRGWYHGHSRATQVHHPTDRFRGTTFMYDDQVYNSPRIPPSIYTSATRSRPDPGRDRDDLRSNYSRSRSREVVIHPESSGNHHSLTSVNSGNDGNDELNTATISQGRRRSHQRDPQGISSDQADMMTSGLGRSESIEGSRDSRPYRQLGSRSNETRTRSHSHQSYHSEQGSDHEIRGRDTHRRSFRDTQQNPNSPLRYRSQSNSTRSSRHTNASQGQQTRENFTNIEIRPATRRSSSRSSSANVFSIRNDSGYGSLDAGQNSSGASPASTRRNSPRPRQRPQSQFNSGDRSRPPIALDGVESRVRRAEERMRKTGRRGR
ncbi:hypothetical protein F5Y12DRAFT_369997 [Xylaria sp. FL1777]|nr:hypothetical protein F5Y12DRAFT_369997 [Xylaria sp. FL1777]